MVPANPCCYAVPVIPSPRTQALTWCVLYALGVGVATLYFGWPGFLASAVCLGIGFYFGYVFRRDST